MFYVLHFCILFFKMATQLLLFGWDNKKYLTFFCEKKYINKGKNYHLKKKNLKRGPLNKKRVRTLNKFLFLFGIIPIGCTQNLKILPSIGLHLKKQKQKNMLSSFVMVLPWQLVNADLAELRTHVRAFVRDHVSVIWLLRPSEALTMKDKNMSLSTML